MTKITEKTKPSWLKLKQEEVEKIVLDLAKQGLTTEKIGLVLRDNYGVPTTKLYGKKITQILKEKNIGPKSSLYNAEKNRDKLNAHFEKNKQDKKAKYALIEKSATALKLKKYQTRKAK